MQTPGRVEDHPGGRSPPSVHPACGEHVSYHFSSIQPCICQPLATMTGCTSRSQGRRHGAVEQRLARGGCEGDEEPDFVALAARNRISSSQDGAENGRLRYRLAWGLRIKLFTLSE